MQKNWIIWKKHWHKAENKIGVLFFAHERFWIFLLLLKPKFLFGYIVRETCLQVNTAGCFMQPFSSTFNYSFPKRGTKVYSSIKWRKVRASLYIFNIHEIHFKKFSWCIIMIILLGLNLPTTSLYANTVSSPLSLI